MVFELVETSVRDLLSLGWLHGVLQKYQNEGKKYWKLYFHGTVSFP